MNCHDINASFLCNKLFCRCISIFIFFTVEVVNKTSNIHEEQKPMKIGEKKMAAMADEKLPIVPHEPGGKVSGALSTQSMSNTKFKIVKQLCMYGFISIMWHKIKLL